MLIIVVRFLGVVVLIIDLLNSRFFKFIAKITKLNVIAKKETILSAFYRLLWSI